MKPIPLWLTASGVSALLNLLVDRLDSAEQRGSGKAQSVALSEKTWPALYEAPVESLKEELWGHVVEMGRWGWLQVRPEGATKVPHGYAMSPRLAILNLPSVRAAVGRPCRVKSSVERWREAVEGGLLASAEVKKLAGDYCIDVPGRSMEDLVQRLNELPELAKHSLLLREVSSKLFWGMSKVLDKRQGLVAAILGVDECPFPESPVQMQVRLPQAGLGAVLFIENQMTFEQSIRSTTGRFDGYALVFASGFKGSAQRLRAANGCSLYYSNRGALDSASRAAFEDWLRGLSDVPTGAHFWGDLDYSGMRILFAMRRSFPRLTAWVPGYAPMVSALLSGGGHAPDAADKQGQQPVTGTGCSYADEQLLPALQRGGNFVDQEMFSL